MTASDPRLLPGPNSRAKSSHPRQGRRLSVSLFRLADDFGAHQKSLRNGQSERLGCARVDDEAVARRGLDRQGGGVGTAKDAIDMRSGELGVQSYRERLRRIGKQSTCRPPLAAGA